jgi:DNA (cytosine-5)-methyltransferase 1
MGALVLSLFPGIGLLDAAFEAEGFTVVRGPDILWGGDIHDFHVPTGVFAGVIGGPPCQTFSNAKHVGGANAAVDLIGEFVRVVREAQPQWVVMENVIQARKSPAIPSEWIPAVLRDWDCGGFTNRRRAFWTWPFMVLSPPARPGTPSRSVIASTNRQGKSGSRYYDSRGFLTADLPTEEYGRLQGAQDVADRLVRMSASKRFIVNVLGNGVPLAMGRYVARSVTQTQGVSHGSSCNAIRSTGGMTNLRNIRR